MCRYSVGHMVMTFTDRCFHQVNTWTPSMGSPDDSLTPGHIGVVGFFPAATLAYLKDKPPHWAIDTALGQHPVVI